MPKNKVSVHFLEISIALKIRFLSANSKNSSGDETIISSFQIFNRYFYHIKWFLKKPFNYFFFVLLRSFETFTQFNKFTENFWKMQFWCFDHFDRKFRFNPRIPTYFLTILTLTWSGIILENVRKTLVLGTKCSCVLQ